MDEVFFYGLPEKTTKPLVLLNLTSVLKRKVPTKIDSKCEMDSSSFSDADCSSSNDFHTDNKPEQCENGNESASQTDTESAHSSSSSETDSNSSSDADSSSSCDSDEDYMPEDDHYLSVDEKRQSSLRKRPIKITLKLDSDGNYTKS